MDPSLPDSFQLTGTSKMSLNQRFSQTPVEQLNWSRMRPIDPELRLVSESPLFLLGNRDPSSPPRRQVGVSHKVEQRLKRRRSVWTRLGGLQATRCLSAFKPPGFWSFRNKYRRRSWFCSSCRRRRNLKRGVGRRRLLKTTKVHRLTSAGRRQTRVQRSKKDVPTRQQLDAQLDEYWSTSRRTLDQQLDEYMAMAGQTLLWEGDGLKTEAEDWD